MPGRGMGSMKNKRQTSMKGWDSGSLQDWTKSELYAHAKKMGIVGRSEMSKRELVQALKKAW